MLYLADVKADKFVLPHHSSKVWGTAAVSTKIGNFWAKPGSCMQTKACDSWRQPVYLLSLTIVASAFPISAPKPSLLPIWANRAGNLVSVQEEHRRAALISPFPWLQWRKANSLKVYSGSHWRQHWGSFKKKQQKNNKTERTPLYLLCCVCSTATASLCHQKERIYELHLESPKSYESNALMIFSICLHPWKEQGLLHLHSVLVKSQLLSLLQLHTLSLPPCKRKELQLCHLLSCWWRGADVIRQKLYMSCLYLRDHLI